MYISPLVTLLERSAADRLASMQRTVQLAAGSNSGGKAAECQAEGRFDMISVQDFMKNVNHAERQAELW